jgi:hypothetical protein
VAELEARMKNAEAGPVSRIYGGAMSLAFAQRAEQPLELSSLRIGRAYVLHLPGEAMIEFQRFAQLERPDAFVAVAAYGDCGPGYVCTDEAYEQGGYEPTATRTAPGSEEALKSAIRHLLGLKEQPAPDTSDSPAEVPAMQPSLQP